MRQYISLSHQFLPQLTLPGDNDHIYHFAVKGRFNTQQINDTCNVLFTSRKGQFLIPGVLDAKFESIPLPTIDTVFPLN